jgi:hypothetical protein
VSTNNTKNANKICVKSTKYKAGANALIREKNADVRKNIMRLTSKENASRFLIEQIPLLW